jgi:hypothetical protein
MIGNIPKVAHCFWYHPQGLPYLRFLSIASFALLNPDYELIYYIPTIPLSTGRVFNSHEQSNQVITSDCTDLLLSIGNVTLRHVDPSSRSFPICLAKTAVHFTDLFRLEILTMEGGYWIDSDIVFTKPVSHSIYVAPEFGNVNTVHTLSSLGPICPYVSHRISFMGASPGNSFFAALLNAAISRPNTGDYEVYGASLYQSMYPTLDRLYSSHPDCTFVMLPTAAIYGIDLSAFISKRFSLESILSSTVFLGVHWYGGGDHLRDLYSKVQHFNPRRNSLGDILLNPNLLESLFLFAESLALPVLQLQRGEG